MHWWIFGRERTIGKVARGWSSRSELPGLIGRFLAGSLIVVVLFALGAPFARAQNSQNSMRNILGTITKSATDAVQGSVDKALGNTTGGNAATKTSGTQGELATPARSPTPQVLAEPQVAQASSATPGGLGRRPATQAQIDTEVEQFHRNCTTSNAYLRSLHDCECLTRGERTALETNRSTQPTTDQKYQLGQTCPAAKKVTYDWVYKSCDDYFQHNRTDHVQFCGCTAERFSTSFGAHPNSNLRMVEALRRESMQACGLSDRSHNTH